MKVENFKGRIKDKAVKEDKKNNNYYEFEIEYENGKKHTHRWFTAKDEVGEKVAQGIKKEDLVEGMMEVTEKEWDGKKITFRNIKEMHKTGEEVIRSEEAEAVEPIHDEVNGAALGLACHLSTECLLSVVSGMWNEQGFFEKYGTLVKNFYKENVKIKKELSEE